MRLMEMSISAGVLILFVALLRERRLLRLPKRTVMMLWTVVLARLLLPFSLPAGNGIASPALFLIQKLSFRLDVVQGVHAGGIMTRGMKEAVNVHSGISVKEAAFQAAWLVWIGGMAVLGMYFAYSFWKEYRLLAQAIPLESGTARGQRLYKSYESVQRMTQAKRRHKKNQIWIHDRIRSPLVFGIIRQRIVLPKHMSGISQDQLQYVLMHEMIHIKRHDNLRKLLAAAALCIHWFNPLAWLMYLLYFADLELSCDECVLSLCGQNGRQKYAQALLAFVQNQIETSVFCCGFLKKPVKERIVAIMNYKKLTGTGILCAAILLLGASSVFASNESVKGLDNSQDQIVQNRENEDADAADYVTSAFTEVKTSDRKSQDGRGEGGDTAKENCRIIVKERDGSDNISLSIDGSSDYNAKIKGDGIYYTDQNGNVYKLTKDDDGSVYRLTEADKDNDVYRLESGKGQSGGNTEEIQKTAFGSDESAGTDTGVKPEPVELSVETVLNESEAEKMLNESVKE